MLGHPRLMKKKIVIVGGGVIGLASALYCARAGHEVLQLDSGPEGLPGCSHGNAGMIVPSHFVPLAAPGMVALGLKWMWNPESPFYIKPRLDGELLDWGLKFWKAANRGHVQRSAPLLRDLHLRSRACFQELASGSSLDFGLVQKGLLMLCKTRHGLDEEAHGALRARELGIPAEVLDRDQTARLDPNISMDVAGSVYYPKDCHLTPQKFMASMEQDFCALGGRRIWNSEVLHWNRSNRRIASVQTMSGTYEAEEFVLAAGSWSSAVGRTLNLRLPMQPGKGYSLTLASPRQLPEICAILTEARIAVTPMGSTLRFGGTMEMAGLNTEINPLRVRGITRAIPDYYPQFETSDFEGVKPWAGLRPCSPDGLPYLGRVRSMENLVVATGHAMMGLSLAPVTGEIVADLLSGRKPGIDISLLSPDRYGS